MAAPGPTPNAGTGLAPNVAGALAYLLSPITGVLFLVVEKNDAFVRFHAMQSVVFGALCIALWIALMVLSMVPIIGWIAGPIVGLLASLAALVIWLLLMWKAYQGQEWELPVVGPIARKQLGSLTV